MKWVTRRSIRVNRLATAWLIRRFIDPDAVFLFVEATEVAAIQESEGALGFDAPGATYPHADARGRCSFEALVDEHCEGDEVLHAMALIVRGADFPEQASPTPESAGLRTISRGFPLVSASDAETIERGQFVYDALYASLGERVRARPHT